MKGAGIPAVPVQALRIHIGVHGRVQRIVGKKAHCKRPFDRRAALCAVGQRAEKGAGAVLVDERAHFAGPAGQAQGKHAQHKERVGSLRAQAQRVAFHPA